MSDENTATAEITYDTPYAEFNRTYDFYDRIYSYRPAYVCIVNKSDTPLWAPYLGRYGRTLKAINSDTVTEESTSADFIEWQMLRPAKGIRKRWSYRDKMAADYTNHRIDFGSYDEMVATVRGIMNPIKEANGWPIETDEVEEPAESEETPTQGE